VSIGTENYIARDERYLLLADVFFV